MKTKPGLLVLDAHKNAHDIFITATWAKKKYNPEHIIMPLAGYLLHVPLLKQYITSFALRHNINFMPVYRRIENNPESLLMRILVSFYPKTLTQAMKDKANQDYITKSKQALQSKGNIVIVSPYGGPTQYGGKVKYGVNKLLEENSPTILTHTRFSLHYFSYATHHRAIRNLEPLNIQFEDLDTLFH